MEKNQRIDLFLELVHCSYPLCYACYDAQGGLLESRGDAGMIPDTLFRHSGALQQASEAPGTEPLLLTRYGLLTWLAVRSFRQEALEQLYVLGPFFAGNADDEVLDALLKVAAAYASPDWQPKLRNTIQNLPVVSLVLYTQYAVMLHYLATGEHIPASAIQYLADVQEAGHDFPNLKAHTPPKDRIHIYRAERALLHAVREGDRSATAMQEAGKLARVRSYTDNALRNVQIACTTFAALCTRAAIEGGLPASLCYGLGDAYIKSFFLAKSQQEVAELKDQMYRDFINRVHRHRTNPKYSKMVQASCDYIELHLTEELSISLLAERLGYAKYYLSSRFKQETGCSIHSYIKFARVERAKLLLETTAKPVERIAGECGFSTYSFFATIFKQCVGKTPTAYRQAALTV